MFPFSFHPFYWTLLIKISIFYCLTPFSGELTTSLRSPRCRSGLRRRTSGLCAGQWVIFAQRTTCRGVVMRQGEWVKYWTIHNRYHWWINVNDTLKKGNIMVRMVFDTGYIYVYILYINQLIKLYYYGWLMMNQYFSMVNWITDNKNLNFLMFVIFPHWLVQRMGNLHVGVLLTTPRSSSLEQPLHYCVLYVAVSHSW